MTVTDAARYLTNHTFPNRKFTRKSVEAQSLASFVLRENLSIVVASNSYYKAFKKTKAETEGKFLYAICKGQYDIPALKNFLYTLTDRNQNLKNYKMDYGCEMIGKRVLFVNAEEAQYENGKAKYIFLTLVDLTPPYYMPLMRFE